MNKNFKYYIAAWAVLAVIFNVIAFVTPAADGVSKFNGAFWSGYVLIMLALIGQLVCAYFAFKAKSKEQLFLKLPLVTISYSALILSFVVGAACMLIPNLPNWVGIVICALILGFTAISVIKASAAAELVHETDTRVKEKTAFIRVMTVEAENLMARAQTDEAKTMCKKVYETLRYSDPMSSEALSGTEAEISKEFTAFAVAVKNGENASELADELIALIGDRNRMCKVMK
jgi:hypothetical protein